MNEWYFFPLSNDWRIDHYILALVLGFKMTIKIIFPFINDLRNIIYCSLKFKIIVICSTIFNMIFIDFAFPFDFVFYILAHPRWIPVITCNQPIWYKVWEYINNSLLKIAPCWWGFLCLNIFSQCTCSIDFLIFSVSALL